MTTLWHKRFPTPFKIKRVSDSVLGKELTYFFVSGVLSNEQYKQLIKVIPVLAAHEVEDKLIVCTLISQDKCEELYKYFEPLSTGSNKWSGQYYVLANEVVRECRDALNDQTEGN